MYVAIMQTNFKHRWILPDPQLFLGMITRAQAVDSKPFFLGLSSALGMKL